MAHLLPETDFDAGAGAEALLQIINDILTLEDGCRQARGVVLPFDDQATEDGCVAGGCRALKGIERSRVARHSYAMATRAASGRSS